jgi:hypothetical protein
MDNKMDNNLRASHITQRRRPTNDKYEIVCKIVDFDTQTYVDNLFCDETLDSDTFSEDEFEDEPSTPTKPTVLTGTNAPNRPKRKFSDSFVF